MFQTQLLLWGCSRTNWHGLAAKQFASLMSVILMSELWRASFFSFLCTKLTGSWMSSKLCILRTSLNATFCSHVHTIICLHHHPHHRASNHCSGFLWVGCWCCISHLSTTLSVASVVGAGDSPRPSGKKHYVKTWMLLWIKLSSFPPGVETDYSCIRKNTCELRLPLRFLLSSQFFLSFFPLSLPPSKSLPSLWSRCTVIPLPSHLLHPHTC